MNRGPTPLRGSGAAKTQPPTAAPRAPPAGAVAPRGTGSRASISSRPIGLPGDDPTNTTVAPSAASTDKVAAAHAVLSAMRASQARTPGVVTAVPPLAAVASQLPSSVSFASTASAAVGAGPGRARAPPSAPAPPVTTRLASLGGFPASPPAPAPATGSSGTPPVVRAAPSAGPGSSPVVQGRSTQAAPLPTASAAAAAAAQIPSQSRAPLTLPLAEGQASSPTTHSGTSHLTLQVPPATPSGSLVVPPTPNSSVLQPPPATPSSGAAAAAAGSGSDAIMVACRIRPLTDESIAGNSVVGGPRPYGTSMPDGSVQVRAGSVMACMRAWPGSTLAPCVLRSDASLLSPAPSA